LDRLLVGSPGGRIDISLIRASHRLPSDGGASPLSPERCAGAVRQRRLAVKTRFLQTAEKHLVPFVVLVALTWAFLRLGMEIFAR
jgi:hypothetical protein